MESYRFIVNREPIEANFAPQTIRSYIPAREVVELRVGDKFTMPSFSQLILRVISMNEHNNIMLCSPIGHEDRIEYAIDLRRFADEYPTGCEIIRGEEQAFGGPQHPAERDNVTVGPDPGTARFMGDTRIDDHTNEESYIQAAARLLREQNTANNAVRAFERGLVYCEPEYGQTTRIHLDEEAMWSPDRYDRLIQYPDPLPLSGVDVYNTNTRWNYIHSDPIQDIRDWHRIVSGEKKEDTKKELIKEVWCF